MPTSYAACNDCGALNKFDPARPGTPTCGTCKKPLPIHGGVTDAKEGALARLVASSPVPVVVDFWAPWCAPCRSFAPTFETTAKRHAGKAVFAKVNTQTETGVGQSHGIRGIPTLIVFANGLEIARKSGALDANSLEQWLNELGA